MRPLLLLLLLGGCRHRVRIESSPAGATVTYRKESLGPTPVEFVAVWFPLRALILPRPVVVDAAGYRQGQVYVNRNMFWQELTDGILCVLPPYQDTRCKEVFNKLPSTTHEALLIRDHGRSGTWTPEDAQRLQGGERD